MRSGTMERRLARVRSQLRRRILLMPAIVLALVLLGTVGGCGSSADTAERRATAPGSAGTTLRSGLHVPAGSQLVGEVFPNVVYETFDQPGWSALLQVDGDPFDAWDAIAAEARTIGYRIAGSRAACNWWPPEEPNESSVLDVPVDRSAPTVLSTRSDFDVARSIRPDLLECEASSTAHVDTDVAPDGTSTTLTATLRWGDGASHLYLTLTEPTDPSAPEAASAGGGGRAVTAERAPASAHALLPKLDRTPSRAAQTIECLSGINQHLRLPRGSVVLADVANLDTDATAVVRVPNARSAFEQLTRQLDHSADDLDEAHFFTRSEQTSDGTEVLTFRASVDAGGAGCAGQANEAGTLIIFHLSYD